MNFIYTVIFLFTFIGTAQAGFNHLTAHSRANCSTINESISWDATRKWWLATWSHHYYKDKLQHKIVVPFTWTWRSPAIHWTEGKSGGWRVYGVHYIYDKGDPTSPKGIERIFETTEATDCNIYDGWWDSDYPDRKS